MGKAYDRIEWKFLEDMMLKLEFHENWVRTVMGCVSTVSLSILHNGEELGHIILRRGLRQGDPLSPYLFIICAEGLSSYLNAMEERRMIKGCQVARWVPKVTHLLFVDDSYILFNANKDECRNIKECLLIYEKASGQKVNFEKSTAVFSLNVPLGLKQDLVSILRIPPRNHAGKYLGLPTVIGRNKSKLSANLKDRI